MKINREIVTLCGSTKFMTHFREIERELALEGKIVLVPVIFGKSENFKVDEKLALMFDEIPRDKITISNWIYVIDVGGYIGESTKKEIEFALKHNSGIKYYSKEKKENGH